MKLYRVGFLFAVIAGTPLLAASEAELSTKSKVLNLTGDLVSRAQIEIIPRVSGVVTRINFREGHSYSKGDVLAEIDPREYDIELREAEATLKGAEARLQAMRAGGRPEEIQRAKASLEAAVAVNENTGRNLERLQGLHKRGSVTNQTLDVALREDEVSRSNRIAAQQELEMLQEGPRPEEKTIAQAEVDRARARVELAKLNLEYTKVRAPFDGSVGRRLIDEGAYVIGGNSPQASKLGIFASCSVIRAILSIPERDLPYIRFGLPVKVEVQALPGHWFQGTLTNIFPFVDPATRTGRVEVEIPNDPPALITGMFVKAKIEIEPDAPYTVDRILESREKMYPTPAPARAE